MTMISKGIWVNIGIEDRIWETWDNNVLCLVDEW